MLELPCDYRAPTDCSFSRLFSHRHRYHHHVHRSFYRFCIPSDHPIAFVLPAIVLSLLYLSDLPISLCSPAIVKVHGFIGDTPALAQIWGTMGCNANVPCFACLNLTRHAANLSAHSACLADTACCDNGNPGPVQRATDKDLGQV